MQDNDNCKSGTESECSVDWGAPWETAFLSGLMKAILENSMVQKQMNASHLTVKQIEEQTKFFTKRLLEHEKVISGYYSPLARIPQTNYDIDFSELRRLMLQQGCPLAAYWLQLLKEKQIGANLKTCEIKYCMLFQQKPLPSAKENNSSISKKI